MRCKIKKRKFSTNRQSYKLRPITTIAKAMLMLLTTKVDDFVDKAFKLTKQNNAIYRELNDKKIMFENSDEFKNHLRIFDKRTKQIEALEYKLSSIAVKLLESKITGITENLMAELLQVIYKKTIVIFSIAYSRPNSPRPCLSLEEF